MQKTHLNPCIDESGHTLYLAAQLVAKKSTFVSLGLFKVILPQASDAKK